MINYVSNLRKSYKFDLNLAISNNFDSLEVVDRGSETRLQATQNLNFLAQCSGG